jgi:hypothetical protein
MKRALTAALVSGLMIFAIPQAAFADHQPGHQGGECAGRTEQSAGPAEDCANQPEGAGDADHRPAPDRSGRDGENHDGDDGSILF